MCPLIIYGFRYPTGVRSFTTDTQRGPPTATPCLLASCGVRRVADDVEEKNDDHCWRHSVQAVIAFKKFDVDHCRVHVQFRMPSRSSSKPLDATSPLPTRTCIMDVTKMATHPEGHRAEGCRCPLQSLELQRRTLVVPALATLGG